MSNLDFQNGFALGLASGGVVESGGITPLDHTVTFTVDEEPYEIVSVKSGNSVNAPITEPIKENNVFKDWLTSEETTVTFPYKPTSDIELNAKFVPIEYIESTGTQYIDAGYIPNNNTKIIFDFMLTTIPAISANVSLCGCVNSNNIGVKLPISDSRYSNKGVLYSKWGDTTYHDEAQEYYLIPNTLYRIEFSLKGLYLDNTLLQYKSGATFPADFTKSLYIFALNNNGAVEQQNKMRLYSFKIYEGETLVRDFVPAIDENGVVCLYDNITKAYFYNKGSGTFKTN